MILAAVKSIIYIFKCLPIKSSNYVRFNLPFKSLTALYEKSEFSEESCHIRTVWRKNHLPKRKLNISVISQRNSLYFLLLEREMFQVLFNIKNFYMNCSKLLPLTPIQNFSVFRMSLKTFCGVCLLYGFNFFFDPVFKFANISCLRFVYV